MHRRMIARLFIFSILIALLTSCAKISSPSGGLRDKKPPVVVKSLPANASKNFKGNLIEIMFNEYVVLDNINDKFMVSPPMKKKPRVFIKGKAVNVELDGKLKDSTTYTFYFLDAIKDLNEGNILQNYQFKFSTGPVIDSLSVTGNIYNALNLEAPEKTSILMYQELADSAVLKHLPEYISRVDPTGYFRIDNVRPGTYRLFGLKDADNSKTYNLPEEEFAFMDSTVVITSGKNYIPPPKIVRDTTIIKKVINKSGKAVKDTSSVKKGEVKVDEPQPLTGEFQLHQFLALKKAHYLTSSKRDLKYQMLFILSLPPDTMRFEFSIPEAIQTSYFTEYSRERDTLKVWLTDSLLYSRPEINTILRYPFTDTVGITGYKQDTILMRFLTPRAPKVTKIKRTVFTAESNIGSGFLKPGQTIVLKSITPFREPDTSLIRMYEIIKTTKQKIPYRLVKDTSNSCKYYLRTKLEEKKNYLFVADKGSFRNIYNEYSDSTGIKFSIKDPEKYCKITVEIKNYTGNRIIQLLDKSERLVAETNMTKDGKTEFPLLNTGTYRLRAIYDLNGDKKWTTGDFSVHRQPEPVSYYPAEIELRDGYDLEFVGAKAFDLGVKNFKDPKLREKVKGK